MNPRPNIKMGLVDLAVTQVERRHALWLLPDLGGQTPNNGPSHRMVTWLMVGIVFTLLLVYATIGGKP